MNYLNIHVQVENIVIIYPFFIELKIYIMIYERKKNLHLYKHYNPVVSTSNENAKYFIPMSVHLIFKPC
jgi:hypothetical protein